MPSGLISAVGTSIATRSTGADTTRWDAATEAGELSAAAVGWANDAPATQSSATAPNTPDAGMFASAEGERGRSGQCRDEDITTTHLD
ncbi:MAG: hypothetical protein ACREMG_11115 [Gemmatimonadales bacterium]